MTHFQQTWNAQYAAVPVAWPNNEFTMPQAAPFVVFNLVDRGTTRETLGRTYIKRHRSTMQIDIYTPINQGVVLSRQMSDYLESVYDTLDLMTSDSQLVCFRTPSSREVAGNEQRAANLNDNWGRYVVECPYDRQEVVSK